MDVADGPDGPRRPRVEPRLVFALVMVAIPLLIGIGQVLLVRSGGECDADDHSKVGGLAQLFVPGDGCPVAPPGFETP